MHNKLDISPLCHKFAYGCQTVVQGEGCFAQCLLLCGVLSVV